jgi:hypothetical protein
MMGTLLASADNDSRFGGNRYVQTNNDSRITPISAEK